MSRLKHVLSSLATLIAAPLGAANEDVAPDAEVEQLPADAIRSSSGRSTSASRRSRKIRRKSR